MTYSGENVPTYGPDLPTLWTGGFHHETQPDGTDRTTIRSQRPVEVLADALTTRDADGRWVVEETDFRDPCDPLTADRLLVVDLAGEVDWLTGRPVRWLSEVDEVTGDGVGRRWVIRPVKPLRPVVGPAR